MSHWNGNAGLSIRFFTYYYYLQLGSKCCGNKMSGRTQNKLFFLLEVYQFIINAEVNRIVISGQLLKQ